jgi:hypothetical protein
VAQSRRIAKQRRVGHSRFGVGGGHLGFRGRGAHLGDLFVKSTGDVGHDAELALDKHELSAVVHLVFLDAEETFEASLLCFSVCIGHDLGEELGSERLHPGSKLLAFIRKSSMISALNGACFLQL